MRFFIVFSGIILLIIAFILLRFSLEKEPIKVGLLYSKSGVMASSEIPIAIMFKAAIKEINDTGGLLSQKIEIIEYNADSNPLEFYNGAEKLIENGVVSIFGCWTSSSRKEVKKVVEKHNNLLFYPLQYEGFEESRNIIYLGLSANQQVNPTLDFIQTNFGTNIYLIGSDSIYSHATNHYIKELSKLTELNIMGEYYLSDDDINFDNLFEDILEKKPHAIINTINGQNNIEFFTKLKELGINSNNIPVFSLSLDESLISKMAKSSHGMLGHYATWGYFDAHNKDEDNQFTSFTKKYFKEDLPITDAMFSIYLGVQLFKDAIIKGNDTSPKMIQKNIKRGSYHISNDIYFTDPNTNHLYRHVMIGKINHNHSFDVVWHSAQIIKPNPFPTFKPKKEWQNYIDLGVNHE